MKEQAPSVNFASPKHRFRIAFFSQNHHPEMRSFQRQLQPQSIKSQKIKLVSLDQKQQSKKYGSKRTAYSQVKIQGNLELQDKISALRNDVSNLKRQMKKVGDRRIGLIASRKRERLAQDIQNSDKFIKNGWSKIHNSSRLLERKIHKLGATRLHSYNYDEQNEYYNPQGEIEEVREENESKYYYPIVQKYMQFKKYFQGRPNNKIIKQDYKSSRIYQEGPIKVVNKYKNTQNWRRLRKIFYVVLFTIYLRTFNERMRLQRKSYFYLYLRDKIESHLLQLKHNLISHSQPFFNILIDNQAKYQLTKADDQKVKHQKIRSIKRWVNFQIECLQKFTKSAVESGQFSQTIYYLCKHGNYSSLHSINSNEELGLTCISQFHGYMRGDKYLEQSAILSLLFVKILCFNIFFQPEFISFQKQLPKNQQIFYKNLMLVGTVIYQILIDIQDELLEMADPIYVIGNWQKMQHRFNFKVAESMTIRKDFHQKSQLISGLADHKFIKQTYQTKSMHEDKSAIKQILKKFQQMIAKYHCKIRQKCFTKALSQ